MNFLTVYLKNSERLPNVFFSQNADRLFRNSQGFSRKDPFTISTILVSENPHVVLNNSGCKDLRNSLLNNAVFMLEPFLIFAIRTHLDQGDVQTNEFFLPETGGIQALNLLPRQFSCAKWSDPNMTVLNQ